MSSIRREPLDTPATGHAADLADPSEWRHDVSAAEVSELEAALAPAKATGKPLGDLEREDFPLPVLAATGAHWLEMLQRGRGAEGDAFVQRGIPRREGVPSDAESATA